MIYTRLTSLRFMSLF